MKKLFRILPPLQWCAIALAALAALLQALAILFSYEETIHHFAQGAILPTVAAPLALLSFGAGVAAAFTADFKKEAPSSVLASQKSLPLPAFGFGALSLLLLVQFATQAFEAWQLCATSKIFVSTFFTTGNKLAALGILASLLATAYCILLALPAQRAKSSAVALLGFAAVVACAALSIYYYFDMTVLINAPLKIYLQAGLLGAMVFFTGEIRYLLDRPLPRLFAVCASLLLSASSLCALAIPAAFLCKKLPRTDYLAGALLLLFMIPHALICLIRLYKQEPTTEESDTERNSL